MERSASHQDGENVAVLWAWSIVDHCSCWSEETTDPETHPLLRAQNLKPALSAKSLSTARPREWDTLSLVSEQKEEKGWATRPKLEESMGMQTGKKKTRAG
jgi:hypothetical protein